ncbi:succinyldiaminopimelate transaminase [Nocardioides sp. zg-536]|uniref:Succinyldiaminopimelate transaminase n=1 Tax=Nocardioides faecalis TaxID=2803858 RepID=A0A938Y7L0_9ACTN|nr:succinyldiaminopimelate transaminase [Nocardioides faecalis]MBS4752611.1 succinyldiaminopimelate transaminase [Nocardioides faecalis]QVI60655.1 succinyldiaminopimelate transaminase [Nocardioides faecalis]
MPDFPWDKLAPYAEQARAHPDGIVDLSIGTPVDPTPEVARAALAAASDAHGYPVTVGVPQVRQAAVDWLAGTHGVTGLGIDQVLPVVGTKELIASLALHLGLGPGDLIGYPELAYPTYEVGAALVGAEALATDSLTAFGPRTPSLLWLNSPSNPSGRVLPLEHLRKVVDWCRERGVLLVSDECYLDCVWEGEAYSVLHPDVCGGSAEGILVVHSLSKRSNLAGYRCGFVAGDRAVIAELLAVRKNLGLMMPDPQQRVMAAVLADETHVAEQHERYRSRRARLRAALEAAGYTIEHSEASLYLWTTKGPEGPDAWQLVAELAAQGILVAPGVFYGPAGSHHVRIGLTATDERIDAAVARLTR